MKTYTMDKGKPQMCFIWLNIPMAETEERDYNELTNDEKLLLKELSEHPWFTLLKNMVDQLAKDTDKQIVEHAHAYSAIKQHWYTVYEILWAFIEWVQKPREIVDAIINEDKLEKDVEEVNKSEEVAEK